MFDGCTSLKSIYFGNFQTIRLNIMLNVFQNCKSLESLDLSSFDTSKVTDFHYMFYNCQSLKFLDLSNFNTSSCGCTRFMFSGCISLTSLNLSSFNTSKIALMQNMFNNHSKILSLDLSNFDTNSCVEMQSMFNGCELLEYVNFKQALISTNLNSNYGNMINNTARNIVFCVDESKTSVLNSLMESNPCSTRISICSVDWRKYQKKLMPDLNTCVNNCSESSQTYKYEYLGKCLAQCPNDTININYLCIKCHSDCKKYEANDISYCTSCASNDKYLYKGQCVSNCSNGYYLNENDPSIKICKCEDIKCEKCSDYSLSQNLCITCNNDENYYPIFNALNNENDFLQCYKDPDGYYFDVSNGYYKKCYSSCLICDIDGNDTYHNCIECKYNYKFQIQINNNNNCYEKCHYYYYLDDNNKTL